MVLALDYDDTFTRDPVTWLSVIRVLRAAGHQVLVVTLRSTKRIDAEPVITALLDHTDAIYFTSGRGKAQHMFALGLNVHVWIDDNPSTILLKDHHDRQKESH